MFPYAMLATTGIFYSNDWPKRLFTSSKKLKDKLDPKTNKFYISKLSEHCIYEKIDFYYNVPDVAQTKKYSEVY